MPVYVWAAIVVFVVATAAAGIVALVATVRLFKRLGASSDALVPGLERLAVGAEEVVARTEHAAESAAGVAAAVARLRVSREELSTVRWALAEPLSLLRAVRAVIGR